MHLVRRFGVLQTANMVAMLYFALAVIGVILIAPFVLMAGSAADVGWIGGVGLIMVPPLYAAMGWVATAVGCVFYNLIAGWVGGIAVELEAE